MNTTLTSLKDIDCKNKRILLRTAFDVPLVPKGRGYAVGDDARIRASIPTIRHLLKNECTIVIATWLGRPGGKTDDRYALDPVAKHLSALIQRPVKKLNDSAGPIVRDTVERMKPKEILLLENVRFRKEEERGDMKYGATLASYGECTVFDAFPQAHRDCPSTTGLLAASKLVAAGFSMVEEVARLSSLLSTPKRPFVVILGGAKILDKIQTFKNLLPIADIFLIGGAMAHPFLKVRGAKITHDAAGDAKTSKTDRKKIIEAAEEILSAAKDVYVNLGPGLNVPKLMLPLDVRAAPHASIGAEIRVIKSDHLDTLPRHWGCYDIGPETVRHYRAVIAAAKTIFWNGPLGLVEVKPFSDGTREIASAVASASACSILGGGDTEAIVRRFRLSKKMGYISTGGGASLEFLAGKEFPVMKYLQKH